MPPLSLACEDHVVLADEERIGDAETLDAVGDLPDLLPAMRARIVRLVEESAAR